MMRGARVENLGPRGWGVELRELGSSIILTGYDERFKMNDALRRLYILPIQGPSRYNGPMSQNKKPAFGTIIWEETDSRSVISLVDSNMAKKILAAREAHPEWFDIDERELWQLIRGDTKKAPTWNRLRLTFWHEYEYAQQQLQPIEFTRLYAGICSKEAYYKSLTKPEFVAWLMCPPAQYLDAINEAILFWLEDMRDFLAEPWKKADGTINYSTLDRKIKVGTLLDMRKNGAYTQKILQTQQNLNVNLATTAKEIGDRITDHSVEALERRLKELESRNKQPELSAPPVLDAELSKE